MNASWKFVSDFKSLFWSNGFRTNGHLNKETKFVVEAIKKTEKEIDDYN